MDGFFWVMMGVAVGFILGRQSVLKMEGETGPQRPVGELSSRAQHEMEEALRQGHKIEAIRVVRLDTGSGLKEAKAFVDAFAAKRAERRKGDPIS